MTDEITIRPYPGPAGGWGSVRSLATLLNRSKVPPATLGLLAKQNKEDGFACPSCAWAKPANAHPAEFCENGAKATAWETTSYRCGPDFFAAHSITELLGWRDYDLEMAGRLTHPMRYDAATDHYVPVSWADAMADIGARLRATEPKRAVFYSSGRASLETSYLYALFARLYGHNNLPDSSNMCHETTSVALKQRIGVPVGTCKLEDFDHADAILFFGQNVGSNSPRLLHPLRAAAKRGCQIITFNPLRERGLERFTDPQSPVEMALRQETRISSQYHQVKAGGDIAAMAGMAKHLLALDDATPGVVKRDFIAEHTDGFAAFEAFVRSTGWDAIEAESGLKRIDLEQAAAAYARADRAILVYGMGLTQHVKGIHNIEMLVNLALMRGNIGREGAGICPVRGHSNVQGQRSVGISEKPELVPLDRLAVQYGFEPPREKGLATVEACEAILKSEVDAFVQLGGNFLRAIPDTDRMEPAWRGLKLQVNIATKLNRNHLVMGAVNYLLPCIARTEADVQASGRQTVTIEDSTSCIHQSVGTKTPASEELRSEAWIVAEIAKATLAPNPQSAMGRLDRRLCDDPRQHRFDISGLFPRLQRAARQARRLLQGQQGARADLRDGQRQGRIRRAAGAERDRLRRCARHAAAGDAALQ